MTRKMVDASFLSSSSTSIYEAETEELQHMPLKPLMKNKKCLSKQLSMCETSRGMDWERRNRQVVRQERGKNTEEGPRLTAVPSLMRNRRYLSKQLSMLETSRDIAWERRRRQILRQERGKNGIAEGNGNGLTDEDLHELKGCIELGFGFNEEEGQQLCNTLPALDLYFAVNRQLSPSPVSTPHSRRSSSLSSLGGRSSSFGSPKSDQDWKICSPGEDPQQVKTKLRHWAQAVACSVMQSY
ncbi:hypothetical protein ERO13_D13G107500v2 [Gossypium hirsutum]|uniref:Uncharacterized protein n=5 Tax=Gossypium TaxID=3633 RepID=A0A0D2VCN6_GOSRA|nr:uncharacterized protein LOC105783919 [Gossypium raimondii]KAB1994818.1 hypothetical protein ES319_D13G123600v1 [Gossypium barbadense]KAG4111485.1 hypothetical protein ERO13_D13G107500v2 [Gossypium hirsutum]TYG37296.1 hypothetical protein ES288_D13G130500v1 [Gossypium darwinii]TYI46751.1 hypothetical protein E1A91_D13G126300v1 [Gossypium mustelinum]KJB80896.1 hypothetical protein B456_013G120500 [Gossypium raimondii]